MIFHMKELYSRMSEGSDKVFTWTMEQLLEEINRERSAEWADYDESDWLEGWDEWCEGDIYTMVGVDMGDGKIVEPDSLRPLDQCHSLSDVRRMS